MDFRLKIIQVGKFHTSWSLTKLQDFGTHAYLSLHESTLTLGPSSFDRRNARKFPFSLFFPFLPPFIFSSVLTLSIFSPSQIDLISTELIPLGNFLPFSLSPPYLPLVSLSYFLFISLLFFSVLSSYCSSFFLYFSLFLSHRIYLLFAPTLIFFIYFSI